MPAQPSVRSSFTETFVIHVALKAALQARRFRVNPVVQAAAERLLRQLENDRSIHGRRLRMIQLLNRGASLVELGRKLGCSRRTVFRELNHLEAAGLRVTLEGVRYRIVEGTLPELKR